MTATQIGDEDGTKSLVERISTILTILGESDLLTLAQIAIRSGIPRSTVHRILHQMVEIQWLERVDRKYRLSVAIRELGQRAINQSPTHRAALPWMYKLRDAAGFHVHLSTLAGFDSLNLEVIFGKRSPLAFGGARQPAYASAAGKMLLAGRLIDDPTIAGLPELTALTRHTITSKSALLRELGRIHHNGVAVAREECVVGKTAVAVPIGPVDRSTHVLSMTGQADQLHPHLVTKHLRAAAAQIWADATSTVPVRRNTHGAVLPRIG